VSTYLPRMLPGSSMYTLFTPYVHSMYSFFMYTPCTLLAHHIYTLGTLHALCTLCAICTLSPYPSYGMHSSSLFILYVLRTNTLQTLSVHPIYTLGYTDCTLSRVYVHSVYVRCTLPVYYCMDPLSTLCTLYPSLSCTLWTLFVHSMHTLRTLHVHSLYTLWIHSVYTLYTLYIHPMCTPCAPHVHPNALSMYTRCIRYTTQTIYTLSLNHFLHCVAKHSFHPRLCTPYVHLLCTLHTPKHIPRSLYTHFL
jgi:hypothetical protein